MLEDGLQLFQFQRRGDAEHALVAIETAVRQKDMAVWIESEKIAEGLNGDHRAGDGNVFMNRILEKDLQGFPGRAAQIGKKLPVIEKITAAGTAMIPHLREKQAVDYSEQCLACIQWCPAEAIQYGKNTAAKKRCHHPEIKLSDMRNCVK